MKRFIHILFIALLATTTFAQGKAKYVFYFIGDGMGVNQVNGTEMYLADAEEGRIGVKPLQFTQFPVMSSASSFSATHPVTDSAAAGTALATGSKTSNGTIGLDAQKERLTSIAEMAKRSGKRVGVTTSVSVDHATPAAFYAHQVHRNMYYEIALDLPKANFDFYGGAGFRSPQTTYGKEDAPHVFPIFEEAGYTIARGYDDFKAKKSSAKKMILIQEEEASPTALKYAIDRNENDLSLTQITESAISFLSQNNNKGFFLMVEGGKIDWSCHANDAATTVHEVIDMDNAIKLAYEFYKKHPKETLIVVTADHETGGMALGKGGIYRLNPKALKYQKQSMDALSERIKELRRQKGHQVSWEEMKELLSETMGFWNELPMSWEHEKMLRDSYEESFSEATHLQMEESLYSMLEPIAAKAKDVMNDMSGIGWMGRSHTASYIPVFAIGAGAELFHGKMDNIDIPKRIAKAGGYK